MHKRQAKVVFSGSTSFVIRYSNDVVLEEQAVDDCGSGIGPEEYHVAAGSPY